MKKFTPEQLTILRRLVCGDLRDLLLPKIPDEKIWVLPDMALIKLLEGLKRQVLVAESTLESRAKH